MSERCALFSFFTGTLAVLALQTCFVRAFGEPYPALAMPPFVGSGGYANGQVTVLVYEAAFVGERREEVLVPASALLEEFPESMQAEIGRNFHVRRGDPGGPVINTAVARALGTVFPGYRLSRGSSRSADSLRSLQAWLRGRATVLAPRLKVSRVEIRWFSASLKFGLPTSEARRAPGEICRIDL